MRHRPRPSVLALLLALLLLAPAGARGAAEPGAAEDAAARPIQLADILAWKDIRGRILSDDGRWFAYRLQPNEGDSEIVVRAVADTSEHRFDVGEQPPFGGGSAMAFSGDGDWFAFEKRPTAAAVAKARESRKPPQSTAVLVDLRDGATVEYEGIASFAFSGTGWLALHRAPDPEAEREDDAPGTDLLVRRLGDGATLTLGNVGEYGFNEPGAALAITVATSGAAGNGVQLHYPASGRIVPLDSGEGRYSRLSWTEEGDALAVLRTIEVGEQKRQAVLGFAGLDGDAPRTVRYDPHADMDFPRGMTISPDHAPTWSEDRAALVFRIHEPDGEAPEEEADDEGTGEDVPGEDEEPPAAEDAPEEDGSADEDLDTADLVIWHWKDRRLQSRQQVQERLDRSFGYLATYRIDEDRFLRLADEDAREAEPAPGQRFAIATDSAPYERMASLDGRYFQDVYVVDMRTGERHLAVEKNRWPLDPSPAGTHFLYFDEGNFHVYDMETRTSTNVTGDLPVPFWNEEDDHNVVMPPRFQFGLGWSEDGEHLVLTDGWDLWKVPVIGGEGVNLTGDGRERQIRYGRPFRLDPDLEGLDLSAPLYVRAYGEWTKEGGIARVQPDGSGAEMLVWDDAQFNDLLVAEEADVWLLTRETSTEFPDYRVTDADLTVGERLTDANPQQAEVAWSSGVRIVDYESAKGDKLQGALYLPADYEPGRRYPTVVYIYERLSQTANSYWMPSANGFNKSVYTSNGYAVLMPDIKYQVNDPGMSAVWSVLPALDAAIETGVVDPESVGLHGHSWGGYQTSFLITQTDRFSAAIAGAPLTNMISMYALIYKNSGGGNGAIFESSQGRFTGGPWEVPEAYVRNSPVFHAANVSTPLILLHNDQDGAVDFTQGVEYYNTLRRMDKNVVMLQYVGENHGLRDPANRKDYTVRMKEFFDHYLRDLGMPVWLQEGVPYLDREEHLRERARAIAKAVEEALKVREAAAAGAGARETGEGSGSARRDGGGPRR